jgi:hypothetical protein
MDRNKLEFALKQLKKDNELFLKLTKDFTENKETDKLEVFRLREKARDTVQAINDMFI